MQPSNRQCRITPALKSAATLALCAAMLHCTDGLLAAGADAGITLTREGTQFLVRNAFYEAKIQPDTGGRIVSLVYDGAEMTALCLDGHGGLMEEVHSADFRFEVLEQNRQSDGVSLTLAADAGDLRIVRQYTFDAARPWFVVTHTFQNRSRFALTGDAAPAIRNLALPAGGEATGRELYCLDRGLGTEVLSGQALLARLQRRGVPIARGTPASAALRWMAVAEPAARRALGFALCDAGRRTIEPLRPEGPGLVIGWSYPGIPAGHSMTTRTLVVPLRDFAAVAELNEQFVADSLLDFDSEPFAIRIGLMPLQEELHEVSVITRTYGESGRELDPCDPLLLDAVMPGRRSAGETPYSTRTGEPAWLLHEVYSNGARLGQFALPVRHTGADPPVAPQQLGAPRLQPLEGPKPPAPGSSILLSPAQQERGLLMWEFDGAPARTPLQKLELTLAEGGRRTVFLGVKALRRFEKLRFALAGVASQTRGVESIPAAAVYMWQVRDNGSAPAYLSPLMETSLEENETAWLALTADAGQLRAGQYAGRLVVTAQSVMSEIPISLRVVSMAGTQGDPFGLWHVGDGSTQPLSEPVLAKLADYGVTGLTAAAGVGPDAGTMAAAGREAQRRHFRFLAFSSPQGSLPGDGPPGLMLLPHPRPLWLLGAGGASPGAARAAAQAGFAPALLCERLAGVRRELLFQRGFFPFWLVKDGCQPGLVAQMMESGEMDGREYVWLYLDLDGGNWQRATTEVRSALWAAAWQGLAGAAVSYPSPPKHIDRQLVLWHILRDARQEVALWRQACRFAEADSEGGPGMAQVLLLRQELDRIVGTDDTCELVLKAQRRPFRRLYRVAPTQGNAELTIAQFNAAREHVLELADRINVATPAGGSGQLYWQRIPLADAGRLRWAVAAPDGEASWKTAAAFQKAIEAATGKTMPVSRTFPDLDEGTRNPPSLVWVVTDNDAGEGLPQEARTALARRGDAPLTSVKLANNSVVVFVRNNCDLKALLATLRSEPDAYPPAQRVR